MQLGWKAKQIIPLFKTNLLSEYRKLFYILIMIPKQENNIFDWT